MTQNTITDLSLTRDELKLILETRRSMENVGERGEDVDAFIVKRIPHISKELAHWLTKEKCEEWVAKLNTQGVLFVPIIKKEKRSK